MDQLTLKDFVHQTAGQQNGKDSFLLKTSRILQINLTNVVWAKRGSMVSYAGRIKFTREGFLEHGIKKMFKKTVTGEGASLMKAEGNGTLYLADQGKRIILLHLQDEAICVNGNDLLAFEPGIKWDIKMLKRITGMLSAGLFNVRCEGKGMVAITTHHEPLTLVVTPTHPVITDPNCTVAWSGNLLPELRTDVTHKTLLGRGSGESIQMRFKGDGFVVVQPFEEIAFQGGK